MTRMPVLHPGDRFAALAVALSEGRTFPLPDAPSGHYGVDPFTGDRGARTATPSYAPFSGRWAASPTWVPLVVALSADDQATTRDLIARHGLQFPVGHSADARAIAAATVVFVNEDPVYLQSTGSVLDPGPGRGQRLFQRRHRTAGTRRGHRPGRLPMRAFPAGRSSWVAPHPAPGGYTQAKPAAVRRLR